MSSVSASIEAVGGLQARRKRVGISQQQLAAAAECSLSSVRLLEAGFNPRCSPTRERVERVLAELEAGIGQPPGSAPDDPDDHARRSALAVGASAARDSLHRERDVAHEGSP